MEPTKIPNYEISKKNKYLFLQFLAATNKQTQQKYCNFDLYKKLKKYIPLENQYKQGLKTFEKKKETVIDITTSDEDEVIENNEKKINDFLSQNCLLNDLPEQKIDNEQVTEHDIVFSIKEQLETMKKVSSDTLNILIGFNNLKHIYEVLVENLDIEHILNFGISLTGLIDIGNSNNDETIRLYVHYLLLKKLDWEYSEKMQTVLNSFSEKTSQILIEELSNSLLHQTDFFNLQYIAGLNTTFRTQLFREFLFNCKKIEDKQLPLLEIFLSSNVEYDTVNKFVEILSKEAINFSSNKAFGKLLFNVIKILERNVVLLEQPLKHIIGSHHSIWKTKIEKLFEESIRDSMILSQSIRY